MNNLQLTINVSLNLLTPVDPNVYELIVKFYDAAGAPLNSPYIDNVNTVTVSTTTPNFDINVPVDNMPFTITNAQVRVFTAEGACCFARKDISLTNTQTQNPSVQHEIIQPFCVGNSLSAGRVRVFNPTNATRYKVCYNTNTFNCSNCATSDGVINGSGDTIINLNMPANNSVYDFVIRIYNGTSCSYYTDIVGTQTWIDCAPPVVITPQAVLMSGIAPSGKVYRLEPSTGVATEIYDTGLYSPDIAHTATKMFFARYYYNGSTFVTRIAEYDITLNPFTQAFVRNYDIAGSYSGSGLCAVSNTELYIGFYSVFKVVLSGSTATPSEVFALPSGYGCTGDLIYDPATDLFLISYDNATDFKIGVFEGATGTLVRSGTAPTNDIFGIYQFGGNTFLVARNGDIYQMNLTTMVSSLVSSTGVLITGASQIQSNISIPS